MSKVASIRIERNVPYSEEEVFLLRELQSNFAKYLSYQNETYIGYRIPMEVNGIATIVEKIKCLNDKDEETIYVNAEDRYSEKEWKNAVAYCFTGSGLDYAFSDIIGDKLKISLREMRENGKCLITDDNKIVVSSSVRKIMIACGALTDDFIRVSNRIGITSCWHLSPKNVVHGIAKDNGWKKNHYCYIGNSYEPLWISNESLQKLKALNYMAEEVDRFPSPKIITTKEFCWKLLKYSDEVGVDAKFDFEPIFLRTENFTE